MAEKPKSGNELRMLTCGRAPPYRIVAPSLLAVEMNFFIFSY
jgi:hypothetical protein